VAARHRGRAVGRAATVRSRLGLGRCCGGSRARGVRARRVRARRFQARRFQARRCAAFGL